MMSSADPFFSSRSNIRPIDSCHRYICYSQIKRSRQFCRKVSPSESLISWSGVVTDKPDGSSVPANPHHLIATALELVRHVLDRDTEAACPAGFSHRRNQG